MNRQITVGFNNANLATDPRTVLWSPAQHGEYALEVGADVYEAHPIGRFRSANSVAQAVAAGDLALLSAHQSFVEGGESSGVSGNLSGENLSERVEQVVKNLAMRALMPEMNQSLEWIIEIQKRTGRTLTTVSYPQLTSDIDAKNIARGGVGKRIFQPTDQTAKLLQAGSIEDYLAATVDRGYDGYCLDTFHIRRCYGQQLGGVVRPYAHLSDIAANSYEVHIALGRKDIAGEDHIDTDQELKDFVDGRITGEIAGIIDAIRERSSADYAVLEVSISALKRVFRIKNLQQAQPVYRDLVEATRELLA